MMALVMIVYMDTYRLIGGWKKGGCNVISKDMDRTLNEWL